MESLMSGIGNSDFTDLSNTARAYAGRFLATQSSVGVSLKKPFQILTQDIFRRLSPFHHLQTAM